MEKIKFTDPGSREVTEFFCLAQTQINSRNYLLVTEDMEGDSEAYILKEVSSKEDEAVYEMVAEDDEMQAVGRIFAELLEDVDLEYK